MSVDQDDAAPATVADHPAFLTNPPDQPREDESIAAALGRHGLILRGGFSPGPDDGVPPAPDGEPAGTLLLVGNAGAALWAVFSKAPEFGLPRSAHPLDTWSRRVIGAVAAKCAARALFPFGGPPYWPFQRWAQRAEPVHPSPLGMLIHPATGLWHAYRGALVLGQRLPVQQPVPAPSPCATCAARPCLSACPVDAFAPAGYDVAGCRAHVRAPAGAACLTGGCLARRACPVGVDHRYPPAQAEFHMRAFSRGPANP